MIVGGRFGSGPTNRGQLISSLGRCHGNFAQSPFQTCDPAELSGDIHGSQHRDASDKRSKGGVAAVFMEHEEASDYIKESDGEEGGGYRVRER
jgi:hypothetical protein